MKYIIELNEEEYKETLILVTRGAEASAGKGDVKKSTLAKFQNPKKTEDKDQLGVLSDRLSEFLK